MEREMYLSSYSKLETASEADKKLGDGPAIICLSAGSFSPSLEIDDMSVACHCCSRPHWLPSLQSSADLLCASFLRDDAVLSTAGGR